MNSTDRTNQEYDYLQSLPIYSRCLYLVKNYGKQIEEDDYFYYFDDVVLNIHDWDEDGIYQAQAYRYNADDSVNWDKWQEIATFKTEEITA